MVPTCGAGGAWRRPTRRQWRSAAGERRRGHNAREWWGWSSKGIGHLGGGKRSSGFELLGDPKIRELDNAIGGEHHVGWFDIAMHLPVSAKGGSGMAVEAGGSVTVVARRKRATTHLVQFPVEILQSTQHLDCRRAQWRLWQGTDSRNGILERPGVWGRHGGHGEGWEGRNLRAARRGW